MNEIIEQRTKNAGPIDAVITWVNGDAEHHRNQRAHYMAVSGMVLHENAVNPHRWHNSDEILFCLQSIENFASWTRKIWIVVDSETPDLSMLSDTLKAKISFVYHREIFGEFRDALPTFNSLAIESLIWRIDGLAEHFMYFNDDVFLSAPLVPSDVFKKGMPVLRGRWVDYSGLYSTPDSQSDPAKFNHFMQVNAAKLARYDAQRLFSSAHVVHPLKRSVMAELFDQHHDAFSENVKYRFRDLRQFLPQGLHNHACIAEHKAFVHTAGDHLHIESGQGIGAPPSETLALLKTANTPEIKFLCVNDLPKLELVIPDAKDWLRRLIGGFPEMAH